MGEVPESIRCFSNPRKACPLREAKAEFDELTQTFYEGGGSDQDYSDSVFNIFMSASPLIRGRLKLLTGVNKEEKVGILKPETCPPDGPSKPGIFFGKPICRAAIEELE